MHVYARAHVCVIVCACVSQRSSTPEKLSDGRWNCTVPHWKDFKPHLACNLKTECAFGEDEQGCRHQTCGKGGFMVQGQCYMLVHPNEPLTYYEAKEGCASLGGFLASLNNRFEKDAVLQTLWTRHRYFGCHVGLAFAAPEFGPM